MYEIQNIELGAAQKIGALSQLGAENISFPPKHG